MQKAGWVKNRIVCTVSACALVAGALGAATESAAAAASPVSPSSIDVTSGAVCSTSGSATYPISINLPTPYVNNNVDVSLLLDDTGSFSSEWSSVASTFSSVADQLQADAPGVTFGFGVSMFKDYGGAWTSVDGDDPQTRPFILNQPIITASTAGSASALDTDIANAVGLADQLPGNGGDTPEASFEGLDQLATGAGLDGNGNGSKLDSGPAGALATEETPGDSGDVPPFSSNAAPTSGSLGGIGWRPGALHIAIIATDTSPVAAFPAGSSIPATITSANGDSEPSINFAYSSLTPGDNRTGYVANTTDPATNTVTGAVAPAGAATVQGTVNALNTLGIRVLGMGPGDAPTSAEGPGGNSSSIWLSSMARLTGATDASGHPLVFDTNVDPTDLANAIVSNIQASAAKPVNVGFTTSGVPSGLSVSFSPNVVDSVAPGKTASTTATIKATGSSRNGTFNINFVDASSGAALGSIPVTVACASQPSGPSGSSAGCPPLKFFGVRGSGEHRGYGSTIGPEEQELKKSLHAMAEDAINYPAIDVPIPDVIRYAYSIINANAIGVAIAQYELDVYHSAYNNSVTAGVGSLLGAYNAYQRSCPGGPAVFAGYSQGADVVAQAYSALPAAKQRSVLVTLFGDPHFNPGERTIDQGNFNPSYKAILVSIWGDAPHSFSTADNGTVRSWCLKGDAVCNFTLQGILGGLSSSFPHFHYMDSDTKLAAQWVYRSWRQLP